MVGAHISEVVLLCASSVVLTGVICHHAAAIGRATRLMDKPDGALKLHKTATPLIGGFAILIPTFLVSMFHWAGVGVAPAMLITVSAAAMMLIIGMIDDRANLSPALRLLALIMIVFAVFSLNPLFILHTLPIDFFHWRMLFALNGLIAAPVTALIILGFVNAANMADGINGQFLGSVLIWSIFIAYYQGIDIGLPFVALACSALVAFVYNLRGRLFTGNSGAYAGSLFVALGAIAAYRLPGNKMPAVMPVFWFWLPVLDCVRLMVGRLRRGRSPLTGDRNHFHHLLIRRMRPSNAVAIYLALLAGPGIAGIINLTFAYETLLLCLGCYAVCIVLQHPATQPRQSAMPKFAIQSQLGALPAGLPFSKAHRKTIMGSAALADTNTESGGSTGAR